MHTPVSGSDNLYLYQLLEVLEGMYGSEEYILNRLQEDYQVEAISSLLDNLWKQCVVAFDIKTALIIMRSLVLHIDPSVKEDEIIEYWESYTNKHHVLADVSLSTIYTFVRDELVMSNQAIAYDEYKEQFGEVPSENTILETDEEDLEE